MIKKQQNKKKMVNDTPVSSKDKIPTKDQIVPKAEGFFVQQHRGDKKNGNSKRIVVRCVKIFCLGIGIIGLVSMAILWIWGRDVPDYRVLKKYTPAVSSRIYAGDGRLIAQYARQRRVFMPIKSIPAYLRQAFIAAEDRNFYTHPGVDVMALLRALVNNVINFVKGVRATGASTITQQVARNFFLNNERTLVRKIKEAILAIRMEKVLTKEKILEIYLNEIYLGRGAYGVAAASLRYFGKTPAQLRLDQMAYLAALPKAPNNYNTTEQKKRAVIRRNWVLQGMLEEGYISQLQYDTAVKHPLDITFEKSLDSVESTYYLEEVRRELYKKFGEKVLYEGGLSVHTTLRFDYQRMARYALRKALLAYDMRHGYRGPIANLKLHADPIETFESMPPVQGAKGWIQGLVLGFKGDGAIVRLKDSAKGSAKIILPFSAVKWARKYHEKYPGALPKHIKQVLSVLDVILLEKSKTGYILRQVPQVNGAVIALKPQTGDVLAMVGGWDFSVSKFNRATQAKRQPGSSIKPFVYVTALNAGVATPATRVLDAPFVLPLPDGSKWKPRNFSRKFYGQRILPIGIEYSINLLTVRLAQKVGMDKIIRTLKTFSIMDNPKPYLSYVLGAGETTLRRMTTAYAMLINGGKEITPSLIDRVQDRYGKTLYRHNPQQCIKCDVLSDSMPKIVDSQKTLVSPIAAYQVVHMMEDAIQEGTGRPMKTLNIPLAGKTGTTNDGQDAWFIAATPDLVVGAYVGFDTPKPLGLQPPTPQTNWWRQETGHSVAIPVVKEFFQQVLPTLPVTPFPMPKGVRMVRIDPGTGGIATKNTKKPTLEAFAPGTEPTTANDNMLSGVKQDTIDTIGLETLY